MRREYSPGPSGNSSHTGSPLHAQGILTSECSIVISVRITPACAGNTSFPIFLIRFDKDHPCMRREYVPFPINNPVMPGSPLHAQGILGNLVVVIPVVGITPACAGNTLE